MAETKKPKITAEMVNRELRFLALVMIGVILVFLGMGMSAQSPLIGALVFGVGIGVVVRAGRLDERDRIIAKYKTDEKENQ